MLALCSPVPKAMPGCRVSAGSDGETCRGRGVGRVRVRVRARVRGSGLGLRCAGRLWCGEAAAAWREVERSVRTSCRGGGLRRGSRRVAGRRFGFQRASGPLGC